MWEKLVPIDNLRNNTSQLTAGKILLPSTAASTIALTIHIILTSFFPVVTSTTLTKNKIVRMEKVVKRTRADGVQSSGLKIN